MMRAYLKVGTMSAAPAEREIGGTKIWMEGMIRNVTERGVVTEREFMIIKIERETGDLIEGVIEHENMSHEVIIGCHGHDQESVQVAGLETGIDQIMIGIWTADIITAINGSVPHFCE